MGAYLALLRTPGVPRLLTAAVLGRASGTMLGLTLALAVLHAGGSVADAGWALTAHAVALAALAPVGGRLVDRLGARPAMFGYVAAHTTAFAVLLTVLGSATEPLVVGAAALVGATNPPASAVVRGQWPRVVPEDRLPTAYAVDSVSNSAMFVLGPVLAGGLAAAFEPAAAVFAAMTAKLIGDTLLAWIPDLGASSARAAGRRWRAVRHEGVRPLLAVAALDTFTYGCLEVLAVSHGGGAAATGALFALVAVGEVIGGLTYGARAWRGPAARHLAALHVATLAVILPLGVGSMAVVVAVALACAGAVGGARDTICQLLLAGAAEDRHRTETFAWLTTVMWGGFALGTAAAGSAHAVGGNLAIASCSALASAAAALVTWRLSRPAQAGASAAAHASR